MLARRITVIAIASAMISAAFALPAHAAKRIALVIGNAQYEKMSDLANPANDARAMADKLRELNFELVGGKAHLDVTRAEMLELLFDLEDRLWQSAGATALVYYSGHGIATDGDNWLVPVDDSRIRFQENVPDHAIPARAKLLRRLEDRGGGFNIVILDACRNNPLASRRSTKSSGTKGLARIEPSSESNTVIFYAASPGKEAYDGHGDFSPFATALLAEMDKPNTPLVEVIRSTTSAVKAATTGWHRGVQAPYQEGQFPDQPFILRPAAVAADPAPAAEAPKELQAALPAQADPEAAPSVAQATQRDLVVRQPQPGEEIQDCPACPRLIVVPKGVFEMGSPADIGADDEILRHRVAIAEPIAVGIFEVKRSEFMQFVDETDRGTGDACWQYDGMARTEGRGPTDPGFAQGEDEPIVCASWMDAQAYVEWLSEKTNRSYRLLSEAEWEYAARGGTDTARYWDGTDAGPCDNANGADLALTQRYAGWFELTAACDDGHAHTSAAGQFGPNEFGLHDMLGNAREWVEDCWHPDYNGAPEDGSAWTEGGDCGLRVLRGGSWLDGPGGLRSPTRDKSTPGVRFSANGFRVARAL